MKMRVVVYRDNTETGIAEKVDEYAVIVPDDPEVPYDPTIEELEVRES